MCFREADGEFLWQAVHDKLPAGRINDRPLQGVASTPVVRDGRLFYVSNRCELVCADTEGFLDGENDGPFVDETYRDRNDADFVWKFDMIDELGVFPHNLAASSPLIRSSLVFLVTGNGVAADHKTVPSPRAPSFIAVDERTGELVWEAKVEQRILHGQWSSPSYGVAGGRPQVVFPGGDGWVYAFDPPTGRPLWKFDGNPKGSKWHLGGLGRRNNVIAPAAFVDGDVYFATGQDPEHGHGLANLYRVDASKRGDVTRAAAVWNVGGEDFRRSVSTVAVHEGLVYAADLGGFLYCFDQETGRRYWIHDLLSSTWSSPTVIDGKVYIGDEDGDVFVCKTGRELVPLGESQMASSLYTIPVAAQGVLYIATRSRLYAIAHPR